MKKYINYSLVFLFFLIFLGGSVFVFYLTGYRQGIVKSYAQNFNSELHVLEFVDVYGPEEGFKRFENLMARREAQYRNKISWWDNWINLRKVDSVTPYDKYKYGYEKYRFRIDRVSR